MDYSHYYEEYNDTFPERTGQIYKVIKSFQSYKLTHYIVFEMEILTKQVKNIFEKRL